jgi:hypothetical protein
MYIGTRYSCPVLMTLEFSGQISEKYSNTKFHENPFSGADLYRRADGHNEANIRFGNSMNAPKISEYSCPYNKM